MRNDELDRAFGAPSRLVGLSVGDLETRAAQAQSELRDLGVTFTVSSNEHVIGLVLPFDALPRIVSAAEWEHIERGIIQRVTTLNLFLDDIYHHQKIIKDGVIPADLILGNANFRPEMQGLDLPHKTYVNVCGSDIIHERRINRSNHDDCSLDKEAGNNCPTSRGNA